MKPSLSLYGHPHPLLAFFSGILVITHCAIFDCELPDLTLTWHEKYLRNVYRMMRVKMLPMPPPI